MNELKTYLKPFQKELSSFSLSGKNAIDDEVDYIGIIASNYYEVIKFVLKRMKVKKFDEIRFSFNKNNGLLVSIVKKENEFSIDFDAYVHHSDEQETEYLMEIEVLYADNPALDWNSVIDSIQKKDWSKYCS